MPVTGIYRVEHDSHRLMHMATLLSTDTFPQCRTCGLRVRFTLVRPVGKALPFRPTEILESCAKSRGTSSSPAADALFAKTREGGSST